MNPILLARHVQESLRELVHTTLNSSSRAFEGMVDRFIDRPENFLKGPWIGRHAVPADRRGGGSDMGAALPGGPAPFRTLSAPDGRLRVGWAARTCAPPSWPREPDRARPSPYLWPILEHCRQNKGKPGIKAILIYPMNALATDQARRIVDSY